MAIKFNFETLREVPNAGIGAAYVVIGNPLENAPVNIIFYNQTDADLMLGANINGTRDMFVIRTGTTFQLQSGTDQETNNMGGKLSFPKNTQFYVKEFGNPTTGSLFMSVFYAQ